MTARVQGAERIRTAVPCLSTSYKYVIRSATTTRYYPALSIEDVAKKVRSL